MKNQRPQTIADGLAEKTGAQAQVTIYTGNTQKACTGGTLGDQRSQLYLGADNNLKTLL